MSHGSSVGVPTDSDCSICTSCSIDLSSRPLAQRKQHIRRCVQPPPNISGLYACNVCATEYKTYAGLRQHQKRSHAIDYNEQDEQLTELRAPTTKAKWTVAEEKQLARLECQLPSNLPQKDISIRLAALHPGRTAEGIRKHRMQPTYKAILADIISKSATLSEVSVSSALVSQQPCSLQSPPLQPPPDTACETILPEVATQNTCALLRNSGICAYLRELIPSCSVGVQLLIEKLFDAEEFGDFDAAISSAICDISKHSNLSELSSKNKNCNSKRHKNRYCTQEAKRSKHKKRSNRSGKHNRATIRSATFSKHQRLFAANPSQLAHAILDEKEMEASVFPSMSEIVTAYRPLFEECPIYSGPTSQSPSKVIHLDHPITFREVELGLHRLKQSACGPDGITREHLRAVGMPDLVGLLNMVFGLCCTPSILRRNRTVLIPKKGDLSNVSNWRPITISSLFTRLLHKILASRLSENVKLHHSQRGFTPGDGIMTSYTVLDTIIREHRNNGVPLFVCSIDLTKAFDRVHPTAIEEALISKGVDQHTIDYIMSTYKNVDTIIECHGQRSPPIKMCRGVRQGDTDSPILFNIVMDDFVSSIDPAEGVMVGEARIGCLLFADDIVLLSNNQHGMREHLLKLRTFLDRTHMEVNPSKCRALQLVRVPGTKRVTVDTKPRFTISGRAVPTLKVLEQLKYLGHNYSHRGMVAPSPANLELMLERLRRAALRPWQKLHILNRYLIPRLIHCSQNSDITVGKLDHVDRLIRRFVKATLHLPATTPTPFFYAKMRDGGLSIPPLRHLIGVVYRRRLQRISLQSDPDFNAAFQTQSMKRLMRKLDIICQDIPSARSAVARHWATRLHQSALGNGLKYNSQASTSWILDPPPFWSGRDYIRAIQLRIGLLPTGGAPYINSQDAQCRYPTCTGRRETLSHILQRCPVTHYQRIQRHDKATQDLSSHLKKQGFDIQEAPRVHTRDNRYIPDLLVIDKTNRTCNIVETTIVWEHQGSLLEAAQIKQQKYSLPEILEHIKSKYNLSEKPRVMPFVIGARGSWPPSNQIIWQKYKLPKFLQRIIVCNVLRYGSSIHKYFMAHTWRSRKK
ncbi:unnamed protein product [Xylocopa violacea]|uniref:Retrovirus-related Pol polyprotein from type-2 retrotransposable element R2DM n=1 Tax=Xylocopa violacea TaxID=135666 RepID=A0ABP1MVY9_XYLVO